MSGDCNPPSPQSGWIRPLSLKTSHYPLTSSEWWVLREVLSVAMHGAKSGSELVDYFVHKCEKNSISKEDAQTFAETFDIVVPDERWARYLAAT